MQKFKKNSSYASKNQAEKKKAAKNKIVCRRIEYMRNGVERIQNEKDISKIRDILF